jgi:hypothetical protein
MSELNAARALFFTNILPKCLIRVKPKDAESLQ